ncbi:MAG: nucleoside hydrolase [Streptosporangiales bacterium]|nr:nucleoside hydrolase [Streptosporangiales bacterium]
MRIGRFSALVLAILVAVPGAAHAATAPTAPDVRPVAAPTGDTTGAKTKKVIVDADMGELNDDAVALFMLANSPSVDVLGVTIVAGNTWAEEGTAYGLRQLELIKRTDIPVIVGAGEPLNASRQQQLAAEQDLFGNIEYTGAFSRERPRSYRDLAEPPYGGYPKTRPAKGTAVKFIVDQVKKHPHQVTLFALGPAANVTLAMKEHPEIVPLVKDVIYMGGAFDVPGNTSPAAEFNWWFDPEAAKMAVRTPFEKQTIVPLDVCETVTYSKAEYDRIVAGRETPIKKMFKDLHGPGFAEDPEDTSFVWDALTAAIFLEPDLATKVEKRYVDVDSTYGPNYGRSMGYGPSRNRSLDNPDDFPVGTQQADILLEIDQKRFWDLYISLMRR